MMNKKLERESFEGCYSNDVNVAYTNLLEVVSNNVTETCPSVNCKKKKIVENKPWMTKGLINACKKKNYLYQKFLQNRNDKNLMRYKT